MMMVLEFLNVFGNVFDIKDEFPNGLSFGKYTSCSFFRLPYLCHAAFWESTVNVFNPVTPKGAKHQNSTEIPNFIL